MLDLIRAIMPRAGERAEVYAPLLEHVCERFKINTPQRLAMFLAQIAHESGELRYTTELASGEAYEGRRDLGNTEAGDGKRYKGRGLIQLTGRANYREASIGLATDLVSFPEMVAEPAWASLTAGWFWESRGCNALAEGDDPLPRVTRRINGGLNGIADRGRYYVRALEALKLMEGGKMPIPAFLAAAIPALVEAAPELIRVLGKPDDPKTERNAKAAEIVGEIAKTVAAAPTEQAAVEAIKSSPETAEAFRKAVAERWFEITEAGSGGFAAARAADSARMESGKPFWHSTTFLMGLALLPLVYLVAVGIVFGLGEPWPNEVRAAIAGGMVGTILGSITGFYYGASRNAPTAPPPGR